MKIIVDQIPISPEECCFFKYQTMSCNLCNDNPCELMHTGVCDMLQRANSSLDIDDIQRMSEISSYLVTLDLYPTTSAFKRVRDGIMLYTSRLDGREPLLKSIILTLSESYSTTYEAMRGILKEAVYRIFKNRTNQSYQEIYGYVPDHQPSLSEFFCMSSEYLTQAAISQTLKDVNQES